MLQFEEESTACTVLRGSSLIHWAAFGCLSLCNVVPWKFDFAGCSELQVGATGPSTLYLQGGGWGVPPAYWIPYLQGQNQTGFERCKTKLEEYTILQDCG